MAKTAPQQLGLPFTTWSLTKLVEHLAKAHRIVVSAETVRQVLHEASISWQATRTWKGSRDPEFTVKMARILQLYDQAAAGQLPAGGRVICVDERASRQAAAGWRRPSREPATCHSTPSPTLLRDEVVEGAKSAGVCLSPSKSSRVRCHNLPTSQAEGPP